MPKRLLLWPKLRRVQLERSEATFGDNAHTSFEGVVDQVLHISPISWLLSGGSRKYAPDLELLCAIIDEPTWLLFVADNIRAEALEQLGTHAYMKHPLFGHAINKLQHEQELIKELERDPDKMRTAV